MRCSCARITEDCNPVGARDFSPDYSSHGRGACAVVSARLLLLVRGGGLASGARSLLLVRGAAGALLQGLLVECSQFAPDVAAVEAGFHAGAGGVAQFFAQLGAFA